MAAPLPGAPRPSIDAYTPPQQAPGQRSWLGIDPNSRISVNLARQGLSGYLGGDVGQHAGAVKDILKQHGYTDDTFSQDLTGAQYNALLQAGAQATGNLFTPWSTTATPGPSAPMSDPDPPPTPPGAPYQLMTGPAPELDLPEYQAPTPFTFDPSQLQNDKGYQFEFDEGLRALQHAASRHGGTRGTNTMRDMVGFGQGLAATRVNDIFNRQAGIWDRNVGEGRYAHEAATSRATSRFAPKLLNWERDRDEARRDLEMRFNQDWQREQFGRDDAWRRHTYANDDAWRRYQLEEDRRRFIAGGGRI